MSDGLSSLCCGGGFTVRISQRFAVCGWQTLHAEGCIVPESYRITDLTPESEPASVERAFLSGTARCLSPELAPSDCARQKTKD